MNFLLLATLSSISVSGLKEPVEVLVDRWGVAHIYAQNEHDLFFAQGYTAARDRLFQFEIWRRQATGTVAEILGRRELKRDIGARLHRFRKDMKQELAHYPAIDGSLLKEDILGLYRAFREPISFRPEDVVPAHRSARASYERLAEAMRSGLPPGGGAGG